VTNKAVTNKAVISLYSNFPAKEVSWLTLIAIATILLLLMIGSLLLPNPEASFQIYSP
jgi:hypothetical protein